MKTITGLNSGQYKIWLQVYDQYFNRSEISNKVIIN